jgi:hypothetical protein
VIKDLRMKNFDTIKFREPNYIKRLVDAHGNLGKRMENFLATGNLISKSNLDL